MSKRHTTTLAISALALCVTSAAQAQDKKSFHIPGTLSYTSASQKDTWNTVLLISGAVLVIGLVQNETTLTLLGGAGVLISLTQMNKSSYQPQLYSGGLNLAKSGPVSLGIGKMNQLGFTPGTTDLRPSPFIMANFKF